MSEDFLHYIWKFRLFNQNNLTTESGEKVEILKPGEHNLDSGPDFFNAKIKLDSTEWAGNVEIHINSSDWEKHKHQSDTAYQNILLHVVFEDDKPVKSQQQQIIPTLVLKNLIATDLLQKYERFKESSDWIACEQSIQRVPETVRSLWLERLLIERMEERASLIYSTFQLNLQNWEETFYQHLARNFGFKLNAVPFELVAKALPLSVIAKHKNSLMQLEALLYGTAGMLEKQFKDAYLQTLQNEYQFLKIKYSLRSIDGHLWKFLRLRPANFPSIRLAQFAALLYQSNHLFSKLLESDSIQALQKMLQVQVSEYWKNHYVMEKVGRNKNKNLGKSAVNSLLINTLIPFLFVYGKHKKQEAIEERAFRFMDELEAEKNSILERFDSLGMKANNASRSQALLQLKNKYCNYKQCLKCSIANHLLKN